MGLIDTLKSLLSSDDRDRNRDDAGFTNEPEAGGSASESSAASTPDSTAGGATDDDGAAGDTRDAADAGETGGAAGDTPDAADAAVGDAAEAEAADGETDEASAPADEGPAGESTDTIKGIGPAYAERLADAGVETVGDLAAADPAALAGETDLSESRLSGWVERARARV